MSSFEWPLSGRSWSILQALDASKYADFPHEGVSQFASELLEWNRVAGLLSAGDATLEMIDAHVADSWALLPYVPASTGGHHLDIGSGGGFPGIPVAIGLPELQITFVERKARKAAFLSRVAARLELSEASVVCGAFPEAAPSVRWETVTARAVEVPVKIHPVIGRLVESGARFLCQAPEFHSEESRALRVEPVSDRFDSEGLRRGRLILVYTRD